MNGTMKTGLALAGGYLLGRTKKAKLAIGFGMFLAGKKLPLDPKELGRLLSTSPALAGLSDQVRGELVDATKSAASSALTTRMTGLADSLHERTLSLDEGPAGGRPDDDTGDGTGDDEGDDEDRAEEKPARRRTPAAKAAGAGRASTDKTRKAAAPAGKRTSSAARKKTASGTSGAAPGGARKKAEQGGGRG